MTDVREQFWGDLAPQTRQTWADCLGRLSLEARDQDLGVRESERSLARTDPRNGFSERDFVTRLGTLRVRMAQTRRRAFLPAGRGRLQRRAGEGLLQDLYRRGVEGRQRAVIVTDGCPGLAAALQTVYPRVAHQRCWVHKLRNLLGAVRRRDHAAVKADAPAISRAGSRREAEASARQFAQRWQAAYPAGVARLRRDLPEWLAFFQGPQRLWRRLRTPNLIERCFSGGPASDPADGVLCKRPKRGTDYLLHLQPL